MYNGGNVMVDKRTIKMQLATIDADLPFWVAAEVNQLTKIIVPNETIQHAINGRYEGGIALLCATNLRLLIIDKKPLFLAVEDIRYDMIAEVNFTHQLFDSSIHLSSFSKELWFSSYRKRQLREFTDFIQHKLSEYRQQHSSDVSPFSQAIATQHGQTALTDEQARELLPGTRQAWDRVTQKLDTINTGGRSPMFIRRRVTKFDVPQ
jgi:HD-GYP domain-containing protein (c-di-GMP phosphodiesterase class II)